MSGRPQGVTRTNIKLRAEIDGSLIALNFALMESDASKMGTEAKDYEALIRVFMETFQKDIAGYLANRMKKP